MAFPEKLQYMAKSMNFQLMQFDILLKSQLYSLCQFIRRANKKEEETKKKRKRLVYVMAKVSSLSNKR